MKMVGLTIWIVISVLVLFAQAQTDCGVDEPTAPNPVRIPNQVLVQRVRRCRNPGILPCNSVVDDGDFGPLDRAVSNNRAKKLYISQVNDPGNAKNVALFIAGQRFSSGSDGASGGLTGQQGGYRMGREQGRKLVTLNTEFYARSLLNQNYFSADDTFVGLVFDARFHYEYGRRKKAATVRGYLNYIDTKVGRDVETIFLAGHSRGGCLALRLAQELLLKYPRARVIVQTFDPVCADQRLIGGAELGVTTIVPPTMNPLVGIQIGTLGIPQPYMVWNTQFDALYQVEKGPAWLFTTFSLEILYQGLFIQFEHLATLGTRGACCTMDVLGTSNRGPPKPTLHRQRP